MSPYLRRNSPVDVLDLWPASGLFSSKVNEFLRPRRHVLVEPNLKSYGRFLEPLARKPGFELLSFDIYKQNDWLEVFRKHLPEQKPPQGQQVGMLPKNDTLLVLANPPNPVSDKDHYTPGRWWCTVMESCIQQTGLHSYGSVRILASFSSKDMWGVLPRSVGDRKRAAILTENVAQHALEIAKYPEVETWMPLRRLGEIESDRERVAARTAAQNIKIPPKRELPLPQLAPTFSSRSTPRVPPIPYEPRVRTEWHEGIMKTITADKVVDGKPKCMVARKAGHVARQQLRQDNRYAWVRASLTEKQLEIDDRMRELARVAASPGEDGSRIKSLDEEIQQLQGGLAKMMSEMHHRDYRQLPRTLDDSRVEALANYNEAHVLHWAQRPFEALAIAEVELFPRMPRSMLYFEADENPPAMQKLRGVPDQKHEELLQLFDSLSFVFGTHSNMTVPELLEAIFPGSSTNDLIRRIPSLAPHAAKRARGNEYRPLPLDDPTLNPAGCYQDNLDYDLSDARVRCLPITTLWDILIEYQKHSLGLSSLQFSRLIGGTMTSFRAGEYGAPTIKLR